MDVKKLVLLCGALVLAVISAIMAKNMFSGASAPVAQAAPISVPTGPQVLVATKALPIGTIIDAESLRYQPWPKELIQDAYFVQGKDSAQSLVGTVVRYAITAGQPVTQGSLVKPGDRGFLAAALGPGMRAVTVPVSAQSAVAGFIFPGDHVDLMLTQTVTGDGPPLKASETFLRNLRVLATDQKTTTTTDADGKTQVSPASTVTVEATPKIAEKITVAQTVGALSLSLRSIADNNAGLEQAIASGAVKVPDNADPATEKKMMLAAASRPDDNGETFVTGADVSRFQRSTTPTQPKTGADLPSGAAPALQGAPAAVNSGPAVRVARGNTVTVVPVGGK